MTEKNKKKITVEVDIKAPIEKVWHFWVEPVHIVNWNNASDDWHTPSAENDLRTDGKFNFRMEAKDGSSGFDFEGVYQEIKSTESIIYKLADERQVEITFSEKGENTHVREIFDPEDTFSLEMQQSGWQSILDNFKKYVESNTGHETLHFEITIDAPAKQVYDAMLDKVHYTEWTSYFSPGSHYKGSWDEGSKILFLAPDKNGEMGGMVSKIKKNIPGKYISIEHIGIYKNTDEITSGPEVGPWQGFLENYTFEEEEGTTTVQVDMDIDQEYKKEMEEIWPKALEKLKSICES